MTIGVLPPELTPFQSWGWIASPTKSSSNGEECILLVDDEPMIRTLGKIALSQFGYRVLLAEDGMTALEQLHAHRKQIDLVILDMVMPGWSGSQTLKHLLEVEPSLQAMVSSGFSPDTFAEDQMQNILGFLKKPYRTSQLVHAVRLCLDEQRAKRS